MHGKTTILSNSFVPNDLFSSRSKSSMQIQQESNASGSSVAHYCSIEDIDYESKDSSLTEALNVVGVVSTLDGLLSVFFIMDLCL